MRPALSAHLVPILLSSLVLLATPLVAQDSGQDMRGADISGGIGDRDNTRVHGTILGSDGEPMPGVQIWVMNDNAPANRVRANSRKTGTFLVRGLPRLYTRDDVSDITLRVLFEKTGYESVEAVGQVNKDAVLTIFPVMFKEGEADPRTRMTALLTGKVVNPKGRPIKDAVLQITDPLGELDLTVEAERDGTFEILLWEAPGEVDITVTSGKGETSLQAQLSPSPNPRAILPQTLRILVP